MEIQSCRTLEYLQSKHVHHCKYMVEDLGLQVFVLEPSCVCREEVHLYWHSLCGRLQLAYKHNHLLVHFRVVAQIVINIVAEDIPMILLFEYQ